MKKGFASVLFVGLVAIVIAVTAVVYYFGKKSPQPTVSNSVFQAQTSPTASPSPTPNETANWKTYTNTKYGFEFLYPTNLILTDDENEYFILTLQPDKNDSYFVIHLSVHELAQGTNFLKYLNSLQYSTNGDANVKIYETLKPYPTNTLKGYYYFGGIEYMGWHVFFQRQNKVYEFSFNESEAGVFAEPEKTKPNVLDQILSTFKFTNQNPTTLSNSDIESIRQALALHEKLSQDEINMDLVHTSRYSDQYASGNYGFVGQGGGAIWYAQKNSGVWSIIYIGNGLPKCSDVALYNVPKEFLPCY